MKKNKDIVYLWISIVVLIVTCLIGYFNPTVVTKIHKGIEIYKLIPPILLYLIALISFSLTVFYTVRIIESKRSLSESSYQEDIL